MCLAVSGHLKGCEANLNQILYGLRKTTLDVTKGLEIGCVFPAVRILLFSW